MIQDTNTELPEIGANFAEIKAAANKQMISDAVDQLYKLREADEKVFATAARLFQRNTCVV